jgi:dihydroorotate dehydrogenase (NAD+) catalytic subunit
MGGITSGAHARDFLDAGATVVAVGTESFRDPAAGTRIGDELRVILRQERDFSEVAGGVSEPK